MKQQPNNPVPNFFLASAADFKKIPGSPIAYWVSEGLLKSFETGTPLGHFAEVKRGMTTSDNNKFLRYWPEVSFLKSFLTAKNDEEAVESKAKWFPYSKGGGYRKWSGFLEFFINWENSGHDVIEYAKTINQSYTRTIVNIQYYFLPSVGFSYITSGPFSMRWLPDGCLYDSGGPGVFTTEEKRIFILGCINSLPAMNALKLLNPTINLQIADVVRLPLPSYDTLKQNPFLENGIPLLINLSKTDWNSYETSWDFSCLPLLHPDHHQLTLKNTYNAVRAYWRAMTLEMQRLEEENNRIFIDAYGLQDELTPEVPLSEITLTCNPHYRYNGNKTEEELETLLRTDTVKELISYAIGCMMGRYRLDVPGLIYAHSGNKNFEDIYYRQNAENKSHRKDAEDAKKEENSASRQEKDVDLREAENPSLRSLRLCGEKNSGEFKPDDDGIIPVMDLAWFSDDAANRFVEFIKVAWPPEHLDENLKFVADNLNSKKNEDPIDTIRRYLSTTFFKDHLKTYKKRPIYWLFSSGKQKAFECLVYLHRYNETTLSRMRSAYVTPLQGNIRARIEFLTSEKDAATSASDQRKYQKEIDALKKKQIELSKFDDELRHFADMKISLDLDDGVKVNYGKFGNLLAETKAVTGE